MAHNKKMSKKELEELAGLWDHIDDKSFESETNIEEIDLGKFNTDAMGLFAFNVNCARQLPAVEDSLIPVQRRVQWVGYNLKAYKGKAIKSATLCGQTMNFHPHGDGSIYKTIVNMAQPFKRGVPLMKGDGNFGSAIEPDNVGAARYTETSISEYAYECFFSDIDVDCLEMVPNAVHDAMEPVYLPSKFPNILIEGVSGLGIGYNSVIPPFNVKDVMNLAKRLLLDQDDPDIIIYPDPPCSGAEIVYSDDLKRICEDGEGSLVMRSHIDVTEEGNNYVLHIRSLPWLVSLGDIEEKIAYYCSKGDLKFKDISNRSRPLKGKKKGEFQKHDIDFCLILNKAFDPLKEIQKLYKLTDLQKSFSVRFWAIKDGITVNKYNIRTLTLAWIDSRREYIRRLLNKKVAKITARISLLDILIDLTEKENLEHTITTIKKSNSEQVEQTLMQKHNMTSFIAHQIIGMPLRAFTKDAHMRYIEERGSQHTELNRILKMIKSEKEIDKKILEDLNDLAKYAPDEHYCTIVTNSKDKAISDTEHVVVFSHNGYYKKLPTNVNGRVKGYGQFVKGDYPVQAIRCKNLQNIVVYDCTGKFSIVPVHEFDSTLHADTGERISNVTKLLGEVIGIDYEETKTDDITVYKETGLVPYIVTLSKLGYLKKTPISQFRNLKSNKAVRCVKFSNQKDLLVGCDRLLCEPKEGIDNYPFLKKSTPVRHIIPSDMLIYTQRGNFTIVQNDNIPITQKDAQGNSCIDLDGGEYVSGCCIIPKHAEYTVVITDKGYMKILENKNFGDLSKRKSKTYLLPAEDVGDVVIVRPIKKDECVVIFTRNDNYKLAFNEIPIMSRFAKGKKLINIGNETILHVEIAQDSDK